MSELSELIEAEEASFPKGMDVRNKAQKALSRYLVNKAKAIDDLAISVYDYEDKVSRYERAGMSRKLLTGAEQIAMKKAEEAVFEALKAYRGDDER